MLRSEISCKLKVIISVNAWHPNGCKPCGFTADIAAGSHVDVRILSVLAKKEQVRLVSRLSDFIMCYYPYKCVTVAPPFLCALSVSDHTWRRLSIS